MAMMLSAEICIFAILKTVMSNLIQNIQKASLVWQYLVFSWNLEYFGSCKSLCAWKFELTVC